MADDENNEGKKSLSKLEKLKQQKAKVQQLINKEKTKEKNLERKQRTKFMILRGSNVTAYMDKEPELKKIVERIEREGIKNNKDRELFGLPPLPEAEKKN